MSWPRVQARTASSSSSNKHQALSTKSASPMLAHIHTTKPTIHVGQKIKLTNKAFRQLILVSPTLALLLPSICASSAATLCCYLRSYRLPSLSQRASQDCPNLRRPLAQVGFGCRLQVRLVIPEVSIDAVDPTSVMGLQNVLQDLVTGVLAGTRQTTHTAYIRGSFR